MEGQKCGIGRKPPTTLVEDGQMKSTSRWPFVVNVPSKLRTEVYSAGIGDYSLQRSHQDEPIFLFLLGWELDHGETRVTGWVTTGGFNWNLRLDLPDGTARAVS